MTRYEIRKTEEFCEKATDEELIESMVGLKSEMTGLRRDLSEVERTYLALYNEFDKRGINRGTEERPLIIKRDYWGRMPTVKMYGMNHVHDENGKCIKNRYGDPSKCEA